MELCETEYKKLKQECVINILNHYKSDHKNIKELLKTLKYYLLDKEDSLHDIKLINEYLHYLSNI
jgi:hypothetical protein|tara:strand:+ start:2370 stop:2564 length:195 start_codon:yes stop_codon:yes gene_type:complete